MKKLLSSLLFTSCLVGAGVSAAEAFNLFGGAKAHNAITTVPLNIRSGPGRHYKSHDVLPPDFPLKAGNCTRDWCQVHYGGRNGWASLHYLAFKEKGEHYNDPKLGFTRANARGPRKAALLDRGRFTHAARPAVSNAVEYHPGSYDTQAATYRGAVSAGHVADKAASYTGAAAHSAATAAGHTAAGTAAVAATTAAPAAAAAVHTGAAAHNAANAAADKAKDYAKAAGDYAKAAAEKTKGYAKAAMDYAKGYTKKADPRRAPEAAKHSGWWTNYQRPSYQRAWQPRWWQKK